MSGLFARWQPRYAEAGIATFPVRDKRPAVRGYLNASVRASRQFALKFPDEDAFGLACRRSGITVLDVDAPDEHLLRNALDEFGPTPIVIRSGSGNFQAWYRHNGERRQIRPNPSRPIDILGDGFVVAPPSQLSKGAYEFICGSLSDIAKLPIMRGVVKPLPSILTVAAYDAKLVPVGQRNDALWRACMEKARSCQSVEELEASAFEMNRSVLVDPLPDSEVMRVVKSACNSLAKTRLVWVGA
jgi:hypothetical protein